MRESMLFFGVLMCLLLLHYGSGQQYKHKSSAQVTSTTKDDSTTPTETTNIITTTPSLNSNNDTALIVGITTACVLLVFVILFFLYVKKWRIHCSTKDNRGNETEQIELNAKEEEPKSPIKFENESYNKPRNIIDISPILPYRGNINNIPVYLNMKRPSIPNEYETLKKESVQYDQIDIYQKKQSVQYDKIDSLKIKNKNNTYENTTLIENTTVNQFNRPKSNTGRPLPSPHIIPEDNLRKLRSESEPANWKVDLKPIKPGSSHQIFKKSLESISRDDSVRTDQFACYVTVDSNTIDGDQAIYKAPSNVRKFQRPSSVPKNINRDSYVDMQNNEYEILGGCRSRDSDDSVYEKLQDETEENRLSIYQELVKN